LISLKKRRKLKKIMGYSIRNTHITAEWAKVNIRQKMCRRLWTPCCYVVFARKRQITHKYLYTLWVFVNRYAYFCVTLISETVIRQLTE